MIGAALFLCWSRDFVHEPSAKYAKSKIEGFTVWVSEAAQRSPATKPALATLQAQLKLVLSAVPKKAVATLRKVKFFLEDNNPGFPCASYHGDVGWLKENGYNTDKVNSVEISNPTNFVKWVELNQPYMVLHELAHGFHKMSFGFEDPSIEAAYQGAVKSKKYDEVAYNRGGKRRAYALNNQMEYFAELSEAYFGKNDFQPFDRAELKNFDPIGYEMIERCWGIKP